MSSRNTEPHIHIKLLAADWLLQLIERVLQHIVCVQSIDALQEAVQVGVIGISYHEKLRVYRREGQPCQTGMRIEAEKTHWLQSGSNAFERCPFLGPLSRHCPR